MSRHPEVKWAERADKVFLTVMLPDAKNAKVNVAPEGTFTFSATGGAENHDYELKLDLCDKINVEESKINIGVRGIFCVLEKEEKKWWNRLLREGKPPHYVKIDWDKWVDEDDETGADLDLGGMDFSKFGDMDGLDGADEFDDDSDDEPEVSKPEDDQTSKVNNGKPENGAAAEKIEEVNA